MASKGINDDKNNSKNMSTNADGSGSNPSSTSLNVSLGISNSNVSSTSSGSTDFVKKLFLMLEDNHFENIVRWTKSGNSFVVLDTNEFTKEILPKHFKHSNFASFVRQLNKYDFHKVKMSSEEKQQNEYGEGAWEFKHPDFRMHDREALETIKRKGPTQKKSSEDNSSNLEYISKLEDQIKMLSEDHKSLSNELKLLNTKYTTIIETVINMKNTNDRYFNSITILVNCLLQHGIKIPQLDLPTQSSPSLQQDTQQQQQQQQQQQPLQTSQSMLNIPTQSQQPQVAQQVAQQVSQPGMSTSSSTTSMSQHQGANSGNINPAAGRPINLRPGFHVLLVEDDAVCIQLCRKFLVKFGCTVEVATDGLSAITALETKRYDIVFMDIIMPNLDGATATAIIRGFDDQTPIIAMTGNIQNQDLVNYLQHGMSDILAKPFTKDDLLLMLEKYLSNRIPLSLQAGNDSKKNSINSIGDLDNGGHINKKSKI